MEMTHISLFSGIGGIDIAAEWAGFKTVLMVENNAYCQKVLNKHWPDAPIISDIRDVNIDTIANICYNRREGGGVCDYVADAKQNQQYQGKSGKGIYAENATPNTRENGEIRTERSGENTQIVGKKGKETKSSGTMEANVSAVEKIPQSSSQLTINSITETKNENATTKSKCGKLLLKEDSPMITKSSATTATTQKKSMESVPTKGDIKDVTKEALAKPSDKGIIGRKWLSGNDDGEGGERRNDNGGSGSNNGSEGHRNAAAATNFPITLITGGFPCQPVSNAGKRRGKADDRWLWPEMLRVIKEVRPRWVVAENVAGLINMGLDDCISNLESEGYTVEPYLIPACAVNAPHRRDRIFIIAHSKCVGWAEGTSKGIQPEVGQPEGQESEHICEGISQTRDVVHSLNTGDKPFRSRDNGNREKGNERWGEQPQSELGRQSEDVADSKKQYGNVSNDNRSCQSGQIPEPRNSFEEKASGSSWWAVEPELGRVAHGIPSRVDRLSCLGNAVVPQQIYPILQAIADIERQDEREI